MWLSTWRPMSAFFVSWRLRFPLSLPLSLFIVLFCFFLAISIWKYNLSTRSPHTGRLGKLFLVRAKCVMYTDTPTDSSGIRRLSRGIIIYYHTDCWAVKMTLFHPSGHAWMDGWVLMFIIFLNSFQLFTCGCCLKCSSLTSFSIMKWNMLFFFFSEICVALKCSLFTDVTSVGNTFQKGTNCL